METENLNPQLDDHVSALEKQVQEDVETASK